MFLLQLDVTITCTGHLSSFSSVLLQGTFVLFGKSCPLAWITYAILLKLYNFVSYIYLGFIKTDMTLETATEQLENTIPLRRFGETDEVADAALFLAKAKYITGQVPSAVFSF